jgi:hypothetical protein
LSDDPTQIATQPPSPREAPRVVVANARCLRCGHALAGLTTPVCPECGCPFEFGDPATFATDEFLSQGASGLRNPPGWILIPLTMAAGLAVVTLHSAVVLDQMLTSLLYVLLIGPTLALWAIRTVYALVISARSSIRIPLTRRERLRWLGPPLFIVICGALGWSGAARGLRWIIDEPLLRAEAARILAAPPPTGVLTADRRIGTLTIWQTKVSAGRVHFTTTQSDFLNNVELVYTPPGATPPPQATPLSGPWSWMMWHY